MIIRIKEMRIEEATATQSFAVADQLAKEVNAYKGERIQLGTELAILQKEALILHAKEATAHHGIRRSRY